jgi:hypothetical protein
LGTYDSNKGKKKYKEGVEKIEGMFWKTRKKMLEGEC